MSELLTGAVKAAANLGGKSSRINTYSQRQRRSQQATTATITAINIVFATVTLFYLFRIKRIFRHTLILMLIISQAFKAFWLCMYSAYKLRQAQSGFIPGHLAPPPSSKFCYADGFFVAYGTEAADFVVLLIALHTVLTIFNPRNHLDEGGLYRYRYVVYICWIVFPSLTASLAFFAGNNAYLEQGSFCALPIRPFWYRLALAWVPRYIILAFILTVYIAIYVYVGYKFNDVEIHTTDRSASIESQLTDGASDGSRRSNNCLRKRRRAIRRQLRYIFIYPVVYLVMWVVPFASHCSSYTDHQTPFAVSTAAIVSSALECTADCIVFWVREKPWRRTDTAWTPSRRASHNPRKEVQSHNITRTFTRGVKKLPTRRTRNWWEAGASIMDSIGGVNETITARVEDAR